MAQDVKTLTQDNLTNEVGLVLGTRPGTIMFAPIIHELRRRGLPHFILHTGQHYSPNMDAAFFTDLALPQPDHRLTGVAEKRTHGGQTAAMLEGIETILLERRPRVVLVGGDANTNLAGALAARKLQLLVGHVEAGERSYDWRMPEEHNRVMIDHISDVLFTTAAHGASRLQHEAVMGEIRVSGNPIVDASVQHLELAKARSNALRRLDVVPQQYVLMTSHREENVDDPASLEGAVRGAAAVAAEQHLPVLFLAHPRTLKRLADFGLETLARDMPGLRLEEAVGYLDFLNLLGHARLCLTDSGGVQQEACIQQVPCVTLRDNTEWTATVDIGANRLAGSDPRRIARAAAEALAAPRNWDVPFGDGRAAHHIVDHVERHLDGHACSAEGGTA